MAGRPPKWLKSSESLPENVDDDPFAKLALREKHKRRQAQGNLHPVIFYGEDSLLMPWIRAFQDIDQRKDKTQLLALLKKCKPMPDAAMITLADLLERHQLKNKPGGQKIPMYELSDATMALDEMVEAVRDLEGEGIKLEDAIKKVSKETGIPPDPIEARRKGMR